MSQTPELPPDQSAVLSLLLRRHKSYAEVATMLAIDEQAVRERAYAAIATLGAGEGTSLLHTQRQEIGDYLLGQRGDLSDSTSSYLRTLANARAWAETVRGELQRITPDPVAELPSEQQAPASPAPPPPPLAATASEPEEPSPSSRSSTINVSKRGGALLLAVILVVVVVAVILIVNSGGSGGSPSPSASTPSSTTAKTSSTGSTSSTAPSIHVENQINLSSPEPGGKAKGIVEVAADEGKLAFLLIAEGLEPTAKGGFFYVVWLVNGEGKAKALGKAPSVPSSGRLQAAELLPSGAGSYNRIELTRETSENATQPGTVVLSAPFSLHKKHSSSASSGATTTTTRSATQSTTSPSATTTAESSGSGG